MRWRVCLPRFVPSSAPYDSSTSRDVQLFSDREAIADDKLSNTETSTVV
jgi:hypothetical protein